MRGDLQGDNSILADEVKVVCPDGQETHRDEDDEEKAEDNDNREETDEERGRGAG